MKKFLLSVLILVSVTVLTACGNSGSKERTETSVTENAGTSIADSHVNSIEVQDADNAIENSGTAQITSEIETKQHEGSALETEKTGSKILVAYFSRIGENYNVGYIEKGNTHIIADMIAEQIDGDTFEISTVAPYPDDYDECTDIAKQEQNENARPELAESLDDLDNYDVIFIGYPIWWGDMPMAVYTFLEGYDFVGKTIIPFCTHEGSGLGSTAENIAEVCPDAEVSDGFAIRGSVAQNSQEEAKEVVADWLEQNKDSISH